MEDCRGCIYTESCQGVDECIYLFAKAGSIKDKVNRKKKKYKKLKKEG